MAFKHAYVVPIIIGVWFPLTFVLMYGIAVYNKNVSPVFPYISDTGTWSPESCIFDILLTTGSLFMFAIAYIRYRQVKDLCEKNEFGLSTKKLNKYSLYMGLIAAYGVIIVGCFQETNIFVVHVLGATMCFGIGTVYQFVQVSIFVVIISFRIVIPNLVITSEPYGNLTTAGYNPPVSGNVLYDIWIVDEFLLHPCDDITKWSKDDGGYDFHLVSTITEWIMAVTFQFFLASFTSEFKLIQFSEPEIKARDA
ncbi:hypothetical protein NQ317_011778 [Molorchus minor]|uniref:CWH43-like N-terminal domain-containing protein n=1 Tax=Molorchus minor TaxID=1323400 RepID=A0ABQ9JI83_9CUCU|nr:hypothetical protein NQ317_011778 [Molorchus minor]